MIKRVLGGLAAVGAACVAYGVAIERNAFKLRRFEAPLLPPGSPDVRVLHISDIHLMARQRRRQSFLRCLQGLEPDLVVNTGDNWSQAEALDPLIDSLGRLLDVPGVFVFGSNDYRAPKPMNPLGYLWGRKPRPDHSFGSLPWQELRARFTERGWIDLDHQRAELEIAGLKFAFRGTDDAHLKRDRYEGVAGPADPTAALNVGVTHAPYLRLLDAMTCDGLDLIFAGHTHGGQVCVPGYGALVTNCDLEPARVKGLSSHAACGRTAALQVSAGIGTSPYAPFRFACRPEATLLTLTAKA